MTDAQETSISSAAARMRRHRKRRRDGLRCLTVQLHETEIEALVHKGLLPFETRHSKNEIIKALHDFFDLTLSSNR
jgi:hypothetical protein